MFVEKQYMWIFKRKMKIDCIIDKYKIKLVVKGFRKQAGMNYRHIFTRVKIAFIQMLIVIATIKKLETHQMDVKLAFLNDDLEGLHGI